MPLRAGLTALLAAALLLSGCGAGDSDGAPPAEAHHPSHSRSGAAAADPSATPAPAPVRFRPLSPARSAGELADRLVAAEKVIHGRHESPRQLDDAAFEAQLRYRQLARTPAWAAGVLRRLPPRYRSEARLQVAARHSLRSVLTTLSDQVPAWRVQDAAPLPRLVAFYKEGQRRYGVPWQLLAAVNLVESTFGKVHGLSTAGAQGPMQFMPSTWASYGSGDVEDPHDAILGAAHYLAAMGASQGEAGVRRALFAYNNAQGYVDGILDYRRIITSDPAWLRAFHRWQVVYLSTIGDLWLPVGYERRAPEPATAYASSYPKRHLGTATD